MAIARIDAGLVLGPGAFVITLLAPVGAQLVQRRIVHPRILLLGAFMVVGISFLHYSHFNLDTDYSHYAWARALQGLGYAFFFVPLTVITYSQLKPEQNNKASSLTNFFRNWGGSFGIAFITTAVERRHNFHQSMIGGNLPASSPALDSRCGSGSLLCRRTDIPMRTRCARAYGYFNSQLEAHAHLLAFMDCFHVIGVVTLIAAPLVLLTKYFSIAGKGTPAGH